MFGGLRFDQYAFNEHSWKTFGIRQNIVMCLIVFEGVNFDQYASNFDEHARKTINN